MSSFKPTRRGLLTGTAAAAALAPLLAHAEPGPEPERPWNVLFICCDEHNPRFMSHLGHPRLKTPHMDRLAAEGLSLPRAYVASPVCAPTRQSWLTGLYPQEHGQLGNQLGFDLRTPSLMDVFRRGGYRTACFGKLHTNGPELDDSLGFDRILNSTQGKSWRQRARVWYQQSGPGEEDPNDAPLYAALPGKNAAKFKCRVRPGPNRCEDWVLLQESLKFLQKPRSKPSFLYVSLRFPHYPFDLPHDFYYRHAPKDMPLPGPVDNSAFPGAAYQADHRRWSTLTDAQHQLLLARYLGAVEFADHMVGELLKAVDALGAASRTLVVYTSDHGDMAGDRGIWLKRVMFDGAARKPLILRMPGVLPPGETRDGLMGEVDVLPTLAGLTGLGELLPDDVSGRDLSAMVLGTGLGREATFAYDHFSPGGKARMEMVRTARYKVVRYDPTLFPAPAMELFDLQEDPEERVNRAGEAAMKATLAEHLALLDAHQSELREPVFPGLKPQVDADKH